MTIKVVDAIPERRRSKHKLQMFLKEFLDSGIRYAEVIWSDIDYKHIRSAYENIWRAVKRDYKLSIKVHRRGDKIYLERLV